MTIQEFEQMTVLYEKEIYSFCLYLTGCRDTADELYQDTWLTAMKRIEKLDRGENVKSYLLSVTLRLWKNKKRKFAWRKRIAPTERLIPETLEKENRTCDVLERYLDSEQKEKVRQAVDRLDEKYKIPVLLYYMEEMRLSQIAETMGIPEGTVKSRLNTARKRLEKELEDYING